MFPIHFVITWPFNPNASLFGLEYVPEMHITYTHLVTGEEREEIKSVTSLGLIFFRIDILI